MSKQPPPAPTASAIGPCPTVIKIVGRPATGSLPRTIAPPDHPRRARAYCVCSKCGWGCLDIFTLIYPFFPLSLGDGPIWTEILSQRAVKPKTNQPTIHCFRESIKAGSNGQELGPKAGGIFCNSICPVSPYCSCHIHCIS